MLLEEEDSDAEMFKTVFCDVTGAVHQEEVVVMINKLCNCNCKWSYDYFSSYWFTVGGWGWGAPTKTLKVHYIHFLSLGDTLPDCSLRS